MASPANEGGIGGKFRRRPLRRPPATPYDRPPAALRGGGHVRESGGWISRLVDPASRLIASGASKLFSSVFQKRLTAPPSAPEEDRQSKEEVSQLACMNGDRDGDYGTNNSDIGGNGARDGNNYTNKSDNDGIVELEQLLKQKTFTRGEFDSLEKLLRSRTVEPLKLDPDINHEKKGKGYVFAQENGIGSSKVQESVSVAVGSLTIRNQIPIEEAASPAELAKAYIISRPSKVSSPAVSLQNEAFRGDTNSPSIPSASNLLDLSVAPLSVIRFSGIPERPELGRQTPRPLGRSAIYRMSRSPYFKVNLMKNVQVGELSRDGYAYPSSSQWTPRSAMQSGGKQVLKRGSSVLDDDFGSFGPIRRIRQKSNLSSSKDANSPLSGFKDVNKGSLYLQKPLQLDREQNGISSASQVPAKSSETAQKLFLQLDKLFSSPKEKSSEPESIFKDDSPSKLSLDMLHGSALRSMEDIDSSKFNSMQGSGKSDIASTSHTSNVGVSHPRNTDTVKENGPSKSAVLDVKFASGANGVSNALVTAKDTKPVSLPKRPAFRLSAPEDSLDLDDDDEDNTGGVSIPSTTGNDGTVAKLHKDKNVISETKTSEKHQMSSSQSMSVSSSQSFREGDNNRAPAEPVFSKKVSNFAFPLADTSPQSQPPPIPTMPTPQLDRPDTQNVLTSPAFSYASKGASSSTFSSTAISINDTVAAKASEGSGSELNLSTSVGTTSAKESIINKEDQTREAGNQSKPFGDIAFSGIPKSSTPSVFAFGASAVTNLSNGSLHSSSTTFPFPNSPTTTLSSGPMSSILPNDSSTTSSSSSTSISAAPVNSAFPPFQIGSSSVSAPLDKYDSSVLESKTVKASPFSISSVLPSTGSSISSDIIASSTDMSNRSPCSSISASVMTASTVSSSVLAPSSLFSSTAGSSSSVAPSNIFPSTGSSGFGFNSSVQSNSSSQNSSASTFGASGGTTTSSPFFSNSSIQASSASTFDATGGSIFGAQSTQSGSSNTSQSSTSQFGSFSSAPSFGLGNSTSVSTGASPFGSTSSTGFSFSAGSGPSVNNSSSSLAPVAPNGLFGSTSQASTSSIFSSASSGSSNTNSSSSLFGSSSQPSTSPFFPSTSGSSSSQSTGFSFGLSSSAPSSGTSPFTFGSSSSSSGSVFSFTSAGPTASSISSPATAFGFSSVSPGNNYQMSVEDTMTDDTNNQAAVVPFSAFGQPPNPTPPQSFVFGSSQPVQPSGLPVFQFGGHQNPSVPQNLSPFQPAGNVEFTAGGSFSLGSGGGEKSGRKYVKVKRKDPRKKQGY